MFRSGKKERKNVSEDVKREKWKEKGRIEEKEL